MNIEIVKNLIDEFPEAEIAGPVSEQSIEDAAASMSLPIEGGYRAFLRRFGCFAVESEEFVGLGGPKHLDVVSVTAVLRSRRGPSRFPLHLIPVLADGYGNYACLDAECEISPGEPVVVFWLHDGGDDQILQRVGDTYLEWLESTLVKLRDETRG